ncbi:AAA family ATPase [Halorubrum sp. RMP-47]|uniref:AAA family ATPase n=1 Tax=Halorubrum miltondacostae TaxID=3076378 RepID=UPI0035275D41
MARHTDTWIFNIDSEVWDDCLGHETGDEGGENVTPRFGFADTEDVSPDDFRVGDTVLARIVSDDSGIGAVFEVREVVPADTTPHSVPGYDFEWIVFCDTVQDEFNSIYRENWERFAEVSNTDLGAVKTLATRNVVNLSPEYKQTYINGLLEHDSVTEAVRTRIEDSRKSGDEDVPSVWIEKTKIEGRNYKQGGIGPDHPLAAHVHEKDARIYKLTAPPDNWLTTYEYATFAFGESDHGLWEDLSPDDVVLFHSRSEPAREALDKQASCILGAGIIGALTTKPQDESWWYDERPNSPKDQSFPYLVTFNRLYATGDVEDIEFSRSILSKDTTEANADLTALTANGMAFETADNICNETAETGFPRHRIQEPLDTTADSEPGRTLVNAITANLNEVPPVAIHKSFTGDLDTESLLDGLYFPDELGETIIEQIQAALQAGDHIILTGPPGTGKTEIADRVVQSLADQYPYLYSGAELTTATADWSTFDTVGGYMPTETSGDNADGDLAFTPGIILNRLKDTQTGVQSNEPVIIDELNRADIDKAFGQLFTLLSGQSVQLPFTRNNREIELLTTEHLDGLPADHQYVVPDSWRIFATMNTYDKTSLYEMSYAFMRRFAFIRVPAPEFATGDDEIARSELRSEMDAYIDAWDGLDPSDEERDAIGLVWKQTNQAVDDRSIGPAIVRDMLAYVTSRRTSVADDIAERVTEAVISYIFPQLEGVPERKQIITHIAAVDATNTDTLRTAASDMLQVTIDPESGS